MASPDTHPCAAKVTIMREGPAQLTGTLNCGTCPRTTNTVVHGQGYDQVTKAIKIVTREALRGCRRPQGTPPARN